MENQIIKEESKENEEIDQDEEEQSLLKNKK